MKRLHDGIIESSSSCLPFICHSQYRWELCLKMLLSSSPPLVSLQALHHGNTLYLRSMWLAIAEMVHNTCLCVVTHSSRVHSWTFSQFHKLYIALLCCLERPRYDMLMIWCCVTRVFSEATAQMDLTACFYLTDTLTRTHRSSHNPGLDLYGHSWCQGYISFMWLCTCRVIDLALK